VTLRLEGIGVRYPNGVEGLRDAALAAAPGTLTALIGPNGSGKSTLLRVAAGLLEPDAGKVTWEGAPLDRLQRRERARRIAFLPQTVTTVYRHSVREVVALGRYPHRNGFLARWTAADEQAVVAALAATAVDPLAERGFDELSGGERQRVLVASLLVQGGDLLLLDEPTAALDLHHQISLMRLLAGLADEGRTVVCATHDLNLAAHFADRGVLLDDGAVRAAGAVGEVLRPEILRGVYGDDIWVGRHPAGDAIAVLPRVEGPSGG